ncbi:arsenate reductase ArsC [Bacteriovorax stolpii]|uniref:arsenate reductase ArsC n=1 Tax=Bacteriovorax stolpii TaxID=960 RepID=UPI00115A2238|nr:arsenate reductase ArsC [Bacteriovorax stolpii]QDK42374.1 arsenate reductase ArsC [Bacteriovorax stolpii]
MNILFICSHNSARSQMAEGIARSLFGSTATIESAGAIPKQVNPLAVEVMHEVGIDISKQYAKNFDELPLKFIVKIDYMISLCKEADCPDMVSRTAKKLSWAMPDPANHEQLTKDEQLELFRKSRDLIQTKLNEFKNELAL